jgi:hypothetical protein
VTKDEWDLFDLYIEITVHRVLARHNAGERCDECPAREVT